MKLPFHVDLSGKVALVPGQRGAVLSVLPGPGRLRR